jgi:chromosome segregation ATPase
MVKISSNVGETGARSIRLGGMKVGDLPIAESANAKMQLPKVEEDEKQSEIDNIKARYPTQNVAYLEARIREARGMISKFREQCNSIGSNREQYRMLLRDAESREELIGIARDNLEGEALESQIKILTDKYGPWQVDGLRKQIDQFGESIERFEETIEQEQRSIDKMTELLGECRARDKELRRIGA